MLHIFKWSWKGNKPIPPLTFEFVFQNTKATKNIQKKIENKIGGMEKENSIDATI